MKTMNRSVWVGVFVLAFLGGIALADTVVLRSGKEIEGQVKTFSNGVHVSTENGTVTIPTWRVARVTRDNPGTTDEHGRDAAPQEVRAIPAESAFAVLKRSVGSAALGAIEMLERSISVDFVETPLRDALSYVQEVTGGNFSVGPAVDEPSVEPVTLRLKDVKVRELLKVMLEPAGLDFCVSEGGVIRIDKAGKLDRYSLRVYDVRDLLYDVSDKAPRGRREAGQARQDGGGYAEGYTAGQWGTDESWYGGTAEVGYGGTGGGREREVESLRDRADSLRLLIMATVAPETWAAGGVIGGPETDGGRGREEGMGYGWQTGENIGQFPLRR